MNQWEDISPVHFGKTSTSHMEMSCLKYNLTLKCHKLPPPLDVVILITGFSLWFAQHLMLSTMLKLSNLDPKWNFFPLSPEYARSNMNLMEWRSEFYCWRSLSWTVSLKTDPWAFQYSALLKVKVVLHYWCSKILISSFQWDFRTSWYELNRKTTWTRGT